MLKRLTDRETIQKILWVLVAAGLLASLPLAALRIQTEQSARKVEIVYDYQDLLTIAHYQANPARFVETELAKMQQAGITSIAVYESTLYELELQHRVSLFTSEEVSAYTDKRPDPDENYTYVAFAAEEDYESMRPVIERAFDSQGIETHPWSFRGRSGLVVEAPLQKAEMVPMDPDPSVMEELRNRGFQVVVRLSDNRPFDIEALHRLFAHLSALDVRWIIFSGNQVTGFEAEAKQPALTALADLMNRSGIGMASIELLNIPQKGLEKLAYLSGYDVIRLHSITEGESAMDAGELADRMVLAVKDRNIRMIYLNGEVRRDAAKAELRHTLNNMYEALQGPNGAVARIQELGFQIDRAEPFQPVTASWEKAATLLVLVGAVALIALMLGQFVPTLLLPIAVIGYAGSAGLYLLSSSVLLQAAALGAAISAPALAGILVVRMCRRQQTAPGDGTGPLGRALLYFFGAAGLALAGAALVTGLLHTLPYMLVLEQFRGVDLLKMAPVALVALYTFFFAREDGARGAWRLAVKVLKADVKVGYVVLAGVLGMIGLYYLSRAGNQGQMLPFEDVMRSWLEQSLGVRPRTQEFLIGHPLFIVATYAALKYRKGAFMLVFAVIGLLTTVGTFTHIHTPLYISVWRTFYGLLFGTGIGLLGVAVLNIAVGSWRRWMPKRF